jgi:RNA polymerase sigma-70 factor (ECF subfamily)
MLSVLDQASARAAGMNDIDASLAQAVAQAIRQDPNTFVDIYEQYVSRVYGFIMSQVGNREDAEDLTSQVFLKAHRSLSRFEGRGSLESWLFQIARATINDHWRKQYRLVEVRMPVQLDVGEPARPAGSSGSKDRGQEERVRRILDNLPPKYGEVLRLRFLKRCSIRETAAELGITENNVKVLQFRALRKAAELDREAGR